MRPASQEDQSILNPLQLHELRQLDETGKLIVTLIDHFLGQTPDVLEVLQHALLCGDASEIARVAHDLKGSSSNFGARRMVRVCKEIQCLGEAKDLEKVKVLLLQLREAFQLVREQLCIERERLASTEP
jgi:HPt (histidine-containing phosphotransfer) domain-containing protein